MRVGIYGGSFDPVHLGHLWVAQHCAEQMRLDQVIFVPAATSPLKPRGAVASDADRLMMLRLSIGGATPTDDAVAMTIDDTEIRRGGTSYTIDTVEELRRERGADQLFLLVGSDAFADIQKWHRPAELLEAVTPIVFRRGGTPPIDWSVLDSLVGPQRRTEIQNASVNLPMIELSSGEIRQRVAQQRSIRYLVTHPVAAFIRSHSLYQAVASPPL